MLKRILMTSALVPVAMIPAAGHATGTYIFRSFHNLPLTVTPSNAPSLSYPWVSSLAGGGVSVAPSLSNFSGTVTYSFTGGLPSGVTLNTATGVISGTPNVPGSYAFTVAATDALGDKAYASYSGTVTDAVSLLYPGFPSQAQTGIAIAAAAPVVSGFIGETAFHVSSGNLPTGIVLDPYTGILSGTPTGAAGAYTFGVAASDVYGNSASASVSTTLTASPVATSLTYPAIGNLTATVAMSPDAPSIAGFRAAPTFTVSGALPTGLSLNASTGIISGTPTVVGSYSFAVAAIDGEGDAATSNTLSGRVGYNGTELTYPAIGNITVGTSVSATPTEYGLTFPVTYAVTSGSLPTGLVLSSSSGAISGSPTSAGAYSFVITGTDVDNNAVTSNTLSGSFYPTLSYQSLPSAVSNGTAIAGLSPDAVGFVGSVAYTASGHFPSGLSLNAASGVISGTPETAGGGYAFTVTAVDSQGNTATSNTIATTVVPPTLSYQFVPSTVTDGTAISPLSPTAAGFDAPVTYTGNPPYGLSLNSGTGIISGTPETASGATSFTVMATDNIGNFVSTTVSTSVVYPTVSVTYPSVGALTVGQGAVSDSPTLGGNFYGAVEYSLASGALPYGMSINPGTGVISGTPEVAGVYGFAVKATDSIGNAASSNTLSGTVAFPAASLSYAAFSDLITDIPVTTVYPLAVGLVTPVTYAIMSGSLPSGLSFSATTGAISGTPLTAGSFSVTVKATDSTGNSATATASGNVAQINLTIAYPTLPSSVTDGSGVIAYPATNDLFSPLTWSATGSLPGGQGNLLVH